MFCRLWVVFGARAGPAQLCQALPAESWQCSGPCPGYSQRIPQVRFPSPAPAPFALPRGFSPGLSHTLQAGNVQTFNSCLDMLCWAFQTLIKCLCPQLLRPLLVPVNVLLVSRRKGICTLMCREEIFYWIGSLSKSERKVNWSLGNRKYPSIMTEFSKCLIQKTWNWKFRKTQCTEFLFGPNQVLSTFPSCTKITNLLQFGPAFPALSPP